MIAVMVVYCQLLLYLVLLSDGFTLLQIFRYFQKRLTRLAFYIESRTHIIGIVNIVIVDVTIVVNIAKIVTVVRISRGTTLA